MIYPSKRESEKEGDFKMKKIVAILLAIATLFSCIACVGGAGGKAADRLAQIKQQGYIEVCTEPYFAPYEFMDTTKTGDEQYVGMDIELAKYIAEKIGVELRIVPLEFSAVQAGVIDGKYDLAISAIAYSPVRAENMAMSKGYYFSDDGYGFLVRVEDADKYTTIEEARQAVVVTQSGSVQEALYNDNIKTCKEFKLVSAMTDGYLAVAEGKADICVCSLASAQLYADANGGLALTSFRFEVSEEMNGTRVAAPKEGTESLIEVVDQCIDELRAQGKLEAWFSEYADYAATLGIE